MKKSTVFLLTAIMCFSLTSCKKASPQKIVSEELGINASEGTLISNRDTHGGFNGDGDSFIALGFDNSSVNDAIKADSKWKEFPLDETTEALIYGIEKGNCHIGPFLNDEDGNALMPEVQNGFYIVIDRQTQKDKASGADILHRSSFNFTVGLYDTDNSILYFGKLDT